MNNINELIAERKSLMSESRKINNQIDKLTYKGMTESDNEKRRALYLKSNDLLRKTNKLKREIKKLK